MGIYRWYSAALLVVAFSTSAFAATVTSTVPRASVETLLKNASPVLNENPIGYVQAYDSPFQYQQRPYSAPVQQKITIPKAAVKDAIKGTLKANAAAVAMHGAMAGAVAAVGWVMQDDNVLAKKVEGDSNDTSKYYWMRDTNSNKYPSAKAACQAVLDEIKPNYSGASNPVAKFYSETRSACFVDGFPSRDDKDRVVDYMSRSGTCPAGTTFNWETGGCLGATSYAPLTDSDFDQLDDYVNQQSADFRSRILKEACDGSLSPGRCYAALQSAASFLNSGPSTVKGPTTSSVSTTKNADGTTSTTTTTSQTNFDMQYSGDKVSATPSKTTTTKNPDGSITETEEKEDDNSTTVQKPGEEEEGEDPLEKDYTFTNPDMPEIPSFYEQKYPDGLKSVWDDNKSRFDNSAFIAFMKSFVPSFSGSCPTWGLPMNIMAQASFGYVTFANICYVFDFVKVVIISTAVFAARKIMFGG